MPTPEKPQYITERAAIESNNEALEKLYARQLLEEALAKAGKEQFDIHHADVKLDRSVEGFNFVGWASGYFDVLSYLGIFVKYDNLFRLSDRDRPHNDILVEHADFLYSERYASLDSASIAYHMAHHLGIGLVWGYLEREGIRNDISGVITSYSEIAIRIRDELYEKLRISDSDESKYKGLFLPQQSQPRPYVYAPQFPGRDSFQPGTVQGTPLYAETFGGGPTGLNAQGTPVYRRPSPFDGPFAKRRG